MKPLVTPEGEFDHAAIDELVAANFCYRAKLYGAPLTLADIELATRDAWARAEAEMTRWNVAHRRHLSPLSDWEARELETDGRLR